MLDAVEALDDAGWAAVGEAPPGHVPLTLVADHALWDCWVHERDIVLPLGRPPVEDPGEVLTCLRYAAALGQAFEVGQGGGPGGIAVLEVTDPDARIVVSRQRRPGPRARRRGARATRPAARLPAVPLLEMLSRRDAGQPDARRRGVAGRRPRHRLRRGPRSPSRPSGRPSSRRSKAGRVAASL